MVETGDNDADDNDNDTSNHHPDSPLSLVATGKNQQGKKTQLLLTGRPHEISALLRLQRLPRMAAQQPNAYKVVDLARFREMCLAATDRRVIAVEGGIAVIRTRCFCVERIAVEDGIAVTSNALLLRRTHRC